MSAHIHISLQDLKDCTISLPGSKSESNRALILKALSGNDTKIGNLSLSDDTSILQQALASDEETVNVKNAGTAMRFLTAYYAASGKNITITGNERMHHRPIRPLVDALHSIGAAIDYVNEKGFPPLKINGKGSSLKGGKIKVHAKISSQFISALLMIAPVVKGGLSIELEGAVSSKAYIDMTLAIMRHYGISYEWTENIISIGEQSFKATDYAVESDWSSASYWFSVVALSKNAAVFLEGLRRTSYQGDAVISKWAEPLGVITEFSDKGLFLSKGQEDHSRIHRIMDFSNNPDLAQTIIPLFAASGIPCRFRGLETLRIKETDRIAALQNELKKFNIHFIEESKDVYALQGNFNKNATPQIETYDDHRMAMGFAPLAAVCKEITIVNPDCVSKSYPSFWNDLERAGFKINT